MKTTKAFYIKKKTTGKNSAVLFLFTREYGIVASYFKGCTPSNKIYPLMDIGQELNITFFTKNDNYYIDKAILLKSYDIKEYENLVLISHIFDLIGNIPSNLDIQPQNFYDFTVSIIETVLENQGKFNLLILFELYLIKLLGVFSNHNICELCETSFKDNEFSYSSAHEWSFLCEKCKKTDEKALILSNNDRKLISYLQNLQNPPDIKKGLPPKTVFKIQEKFNNIFSELFYLKSITPLMDLLKSYV